MDFQNKADKLMARLTRLTANDEVEWEVRDPPDSIAKGTDDRIARFFEARYKDSYVAVFEKRSRLYDGERDTFFWGEDINFAVLDDKDRVLWETSRPSPALHDLFRTVTEQASGIDRLLADLLDETEDRAE